MNDLQSFLLTDNPCKILNKLYELQSGNGGGFTQQTLADETGIPKTNVSRACFKLEDEFGVIQSSRDGREKYVSLTSKGLSVAGLINGLMEACEQ